MQAQVQQFQVQAPSGTLVRLSVFHILTRAIISKPMLPYKAMGNKSGVSSTSVTELLLSQNVASSTGLLAEKFMLPFRLMIAVRHHQCTFDVFEQLVLEDTKGALMVSHCYHN